MKCKYCKNPFSGSKRQVYCSAPCRLNDWKRSHPNRVKELQDASRLRNPPDCHNCNKPIPAQRRGNGVRYCSDQCVEEARLSKQRRFRDKAQVAFDDFKLSRGCGRCGYRKCSRSLDLHHADPESKDLRITARQFVASSELTKRELAKCILVCKNCHYELHELMETNETQYEQLIAKLPRASL